MSNSLECRVSMALAVVLGLAALAQAQTFTVLYNFCPGRYCADGADPYAGVIQDPSGNLYGTTYAGGEGGCDGPCGVVYKVDTAGAETVLYSFPAGGSDGANPVAPLALDKAGNLYGTTFDGGSSVGHGVVFKIDTAGNETVLHSFTGGSDGCAPMQGLVVGKSGDLYGTAAGCGSSRAGTIFKIDTAGTFTLLHSFSGAPSDASGPYYGHLAVDRSGNLYGVTLWGGTYRRGALYRLSSNGSLTLLHSFRGGKRDGCRPYGSVTRDKAGNLYGTSYKCGSSNYGTIWKVSRTGKETILHNFAGGSADGCFPFAGMTLDSKGNGYGVTSGCGPTSDGVLYELTRRGTLTVLHAFDYSGNGAPPLGEVLRNANGALFGTALAGGDGNYNAGTVWSYAP